MIKIEIETTPRTDKRLEDALSTVNLARTNIGQKPFENINAWCVYMLKLDLMNRLRDVDAGDVSDAYSLAEPDVQAEVKKLLGM